MEKTKNNHSILINGLSCVCGYSKVYYSTVSFDGISNINQLACPNCGIIMRSPPTDKNGEWLKKHWKTIHSKEEKGETTKRPLEVSEHTTP